MSESVSHVVVDADEVPWVPYRVAPTTVHEQGKDLDVHTAKALVRAFHQCPACGSDLELVFDSHPHGKAEDRDVVFGYEYGDSKNPVYCGECDAQLAGLVEEAAKPTIVEEPTKRLSDVGCVFVRMPDLDWYLGEPLNHTLYMCVQTNAIRIWEV